MNISIRKAENKDLKVISEIFRIESAKKPYLQRLTKQRAFKKITQAYKKKDIFLAITENKIAGFTISTPLFISGRKRVYLDEFWLRAKKQRKGIGKKLIRYLENKYKKDKVTFIDVIAHRKAGAVKFYKKMGYRDSKDFVFMDKKI